MKFLIRTLLVAAVIASGCYTTHSCSVPGNRIACYKQKVRASKELASEENFGNWLLSSKFNY